MENRQIGSNIRLNMKYQGLSIRELSEKSGLSTSTLSNIINGKETATSKSLIAISKALNVPVSRLAEEFPKPVTMRFRTAKSQSAREKAGRDLLAGDAARWLRDYRELEELSGAETDYGFTSDYRGLNPETMAAKVRSEMKINAESPVSDIVFLLENAGIRVRIRPFGLSETFGSSIGKDDGGPAIFINCDKTITVERQLFTAAHELAHILMGHKAGAETEETDEKAADAFASFFLMPDRAFKNKISDYCGYPFADMVIKTKAFFNVSWQTVLKRYAEMNGFRYQDIYEHFLNMYQAKYGRRLSERDEPFPLRVLPLSSSDRFLRLVRENYENGNISFSRAAEMLNLSAKEMRELVAGW